MDIGRSFDELWGSLLPVGRDPRTGGYRRFAWSAADREAREWFHRAAAARGMPVEADRNGNLWAWWGEPRPGSVVTGSHLDSVPDGGPFDGPLGIVSAFCAIDLIHSRGMSQLAKSTSGNDRADPPAGAAGGAEPRGRRPYGAGNRPTSAGDRSAGKARVDRRRSIAVVCFADEEGARFGVACAGSRLLTGALDPNRARNLTDGDGVTLAEAMRSAGHDPGRLGRDDEALARIGAFVELHIEQGRALADLGSPVGVGEGIWPHGRWRFDFAGHADHAGTTRLADRVDPMLAYAKAVLAGRELAEQLGALATFGKVAVEPNGTNAIPSLVRAWLDARAPDESTVEKLVTALAAGSGAAVERESWSPAVRFDQLLTARLVDVVTHALSAPRPKPVAGSLAPNPLEQGTLLPPTLLEQGTLLPDTRRTVWGSDPTVGRRDPSANQEQVEGALIPIRLEQGHLLPKRAGVVPVLATGAGHDAGVLASEVPAAMLFVRNPTGVSHSPAEHADRIDCIAGVVALAAVLDDLTTRPADA